MPPDEGAAGRSAPVTGGASLSDTLLDGAPCGFVVVADDGTVRIVNETLLGMLGLTREALVGRHIESVMSVGTKIFYQTHLFPLLRMHQHAEEIFLLLRGTNGEEIAMLLNAVRRERDGEWVTDWALMRVRERQKFEDALLRAKQQAEAARVAVEMQRAELATANAQLEEQAMELELSQQQLSEQAAELEVQTETMRELNQELIARSDELERQRVIAEEANHAKSAFLAAMSHELRTPLNAIGGYVQLLEMGIHGPVTPEQADALQKVTRSQRHLLRLINEVLNLARIEARVVHYDLQPVSLAEIVNAVLPMVEPQLAERELSLDVHVPDAFVVQADHDKTEQILLNLLGNAIKFTERGGRVSITADRDPPPGARIRLHVSDNGIGIPEDRLQHVFDAFVQVDVTPAGRAQGTGLGLAISRDLARAMNGDLTAVSTLGQGSTFTLELPVAAAASA